MEDEAHLSLVQMEESKLLGAIEASRKGLRLYEDIAESERLLKMMDEGAGLKLLHLT